MLPIWKQIIHFTLNPQIAECNWRRNNSPGESRTTPQITMVHKKLIVGSVSFLFSPNLDCLQGFPMVHTEAFVCDPQMWHLAVSVLLPVTDVARLLHQPCKNTTRGPDLTLPGNTPHRKCLRPPVPLPMTGLQQLLSPQILTPSLPTQLWALQGPHPGGRYHSIPRPNSNNGLANVVWDTTDNTPPIKHWSVVSQRQAGSATCYWECICHHPRLPPAVIDQGCDTMHHHTLGSQSFLCILGVGNNSKSMHHIK